ncbi:glgC [Mytilus coruscus]|uniref:GlgC n=1 Tax=Mytilus coruscus TaxID=42192 RepID=A0A6J8CFY8_MYTCO|nr:glgC [Mytilus coruscus]
MSNLIPSLENFTRCHDVNEPISNFESPRGQAGVSILWPRQWSSKIKKLEVGNEQIIAFTIATEPMLCIINAYMPTINTNSETQYSECLDIIFDIIEKYQSKYVIILAGDLNGTLLQTRTNKHDSLLREFVQEVSLFRPDIGNQPTFFHHAHHGSSQIDYILSNRNNLSKKYCILDKSYVNTSAHCAVILQTNFSIPLLVHNTSQKKITKMKVLWEKRDEMSCFIRIFKHWKLISK